MTEDGRKEGRKEGDEAGGFLSRWSARKRAIAREESGEGGIRIQDGDGAETELVPDARTEEVEAEDEEAKANREAAEAVSIDSLEYESDFAVFFRRGVPEALRRRALRKLWTSHPVLANVDGLNDYDEDFADPALNVFRSAWQVGRGFLTDEDREPSVRVSAGEAPGGPGGEDEGDEVLPAETAETETADTEIAGEDNSAGVAAGEEDAPEQGLAASTSIAATDAGEHEDGDGEEEHEAPVRVSLRSRLFE